MLSTFVSYFQKLDYFGIKTQLYIDNHPTYRTSFGGFISTIINIFALLMFLSFGHDMLYKTNPKILISEVYQNSPEITRFSKENYFFMFGLQGPDYLHFIDNSIYRASILKKTFYKNQSNPSIIEIPIERCTNSHLPSKKNLNDYFLKAPGTGLENLYCVNKEQLEELSIYGSFDSEDYFSYISIQIIPCKNDTSNNTCKTKENINSKLLNGYFAFYTIDNLIDSSKDIPGTPVGKDYFAYIGLGYTKITHRYISSIEVISDDGWLLNSENIYSYSSYNSDKEGFILNNDEILMEFNLRKYHSKFFYKRQYKKLQEVLAEIGGFIKVMMLIFYYIYSPFINRNYFTKITNSIFNFEGGDSVKKSPKKNKFNNKNSRINMIDISKSFSLNEKNKKNQLINYLNETNDRPINISYWNKLKSYFLNDVKTRIKLEQRQKGVNIIAENLNITTLLRKFQELDKLKLLLLDKDQIKLFEFLPKPVILKNKSVNYSFSFLERKNSKKHIFDCEKYDDIISSANHLYDAFNRIRKKKNLSIIDEKLLDFLDENIKNILYQDNISTNTKSAMFLTENTSKVTISNHNFLNR